MHQRTKAFGEVLVLSTQSGILQHIEALQGSFGLCAQPMRYRCYSVTPSLIGWAHTQTNLWSGFYKLAHICRHFSSAYFWINVLVLLFLKVRLAICFIGSGFGMTPIRRHASTRDNNQWVLWRHMALLDKNDNFTCDAHTRHRTRALYWPVTFMLSSHYLNQWWHCYQWNPLYHTSVASKWKKIILVLKSAFQNSSESCRSFCSGLDTWGGFYSGKHHFVWKRLYSTTPLYITMTS